MDLRSGHAFWLIRNGILHAFPPLERNLQCDVVVVGGGITGALVGYHLVEAGLSAVVLDRRDIGWGSTAASTALLQYEIDTPLVELAGRFGWETAARCYQSCRDAIYKLRDLTTGLGEDRCGFSLKPSLYLAKRATDVKPMKEELDARERAGFNVEWWGASDIRERMGFERPGAIFSKDGAQVDAFRLTYRLLEKAQALGLRVHDRTEVVSHRVEENWVVVKTDRGATIKARHIVFATGYEFTQLSKRKLVKLHSTFALVSEPCARKTRWHKDCLIWERGDPYLYLRTTDDGRVLIGGEDEPFKDPDKRDALLPKKSATLQRKFRRLFPDVPLEPAFCWAGTFGVTEDGLAYIGTLPEFPRAFFALGFGGNGITYSVLAAEIIRDQVLGRSNPYSDLYRFDRHGGGA